MNVYEYFEYFGRLIVHQYGDRNGFISTCMQYPLRNLGFGKMFLQNDGCKFLVYTHKSAAVLLHCSEDKLTMK